MSVKVVHLLSKSFMGEVEDKVWYTISNIKHDKCNLK